MKTKYKLIIGLILLLFASVVLADWEHFKAGLFGKPPAVEVQE